MIYYEQVFKKYFNYYNFMYIQFVIFSHTCTQYTHHVDIFKVYTILRFQS